MGERERERERNSKTDEDRIYIARKQRETERKIRRGRRREMLDKVSGHGGRAERLGALVSALGPSS